MLDWRATNDRPLNSLQGNLIVLRQPKHILEKNAKIS